MGLYCSTSAFWKGKASAALAIMNDIIGDDFDIKELQCDKCKRQYIMTLGDKRTLEKYCKTFCFCCARKYAKENCLTYHEDLDSSHWCGHTEKVVTLIDKIRKYNKYTVRRYKSRHIECKLENSKEILKK